MGKIISIGTAVPSFKHEQQRILQFMQTVYNLNETDARKLKFLYNKSNIEYRYSTIEDYSKEANDWKFYPKNDSLNTFPLIEDRMFWYQKNATQLSVDAILNCTKNIIKPQQITHLITVSCTGMSAPGLDLQIVEALNLQKNIYRTSINFMGCYAAIHALKIADSICQTEPNSYVLVVCTELCTLHFQKEATMDNMASSLLFGDGSAAVLVTPNKNENKGIFLKSFYSEIVAKGKNDMSWDLSSSGFLMKLSSYIPALIEEDFKQLFDNALLKANYTTNSIKHWCIHPGGKSILDSISKCLHLTNDELRNCYEVLKDYGNMSSPTILFVLQKIMENINNNTSNNNNDSIFGAAFGPGLTMETFLATTYE